MRLFTFSLFFSTNIVAATQLCCHGGQITPQSLYLYMDCTKEVPPKGNTTLPWYIDQAQRAKIFVATRVFNTFSLSRSAA